MLLFFINVFTDYLHCILFFKLLVGRQHDLAPLPLSKLFFELKHIVYVRFIS